jgi:hypothetical protein
MWVSGRQGLVPACQGKSGMVDIQPYFTGICFHVLFTDLLYLL